MAFFRRGRAQGEHPPPVPPKPHPNYGTLVTHQPYPPHAHPPHTRSSRRQPHAHTHPSEHTHTPVSVPLVTKPSYTPSRWLHPEKTVRVPAAGYGLGTRLRGFLPRGGGGAGGKKAQRDYGREVGKMGTEARKAERARRLDDASREYGVLKVVTEEDRFRAMKKQQKRQKQPINPASRIHVNRDPSATQPHPTHIQTHERYPQQYRDQPHRPQVSSHSNQHQQGRLQAQTGPKKKSWWARHGMVNDGGVHEY